MPRHSRWLTKQTFTLRAYPCIHCNWTHSNDDIFTIHTNAWISALCKLPLKGCFQWYAVLFVRLGLGLSAKFVCCHIILKIWNLIWDLDLRFIQMYLFIEFRFAHYWHVCIHRGLFTGTVPFGRVCMCVTCCGLTYFGSVAFVHFPVLTLLP